jgi:hypothetical protein
MVPYLVSDGQSYLMLGNSVGDTHTQLGVVAKRFTSIHSVMLKWQQLIWQLTVENESSMSENHLMLY